MSKVTLKYKKSPNYIETFATGIWGGINASGKIQLSFFEELLEIPEFTEIETIQEGNVTKVKSDAPQPKDPERMRSAKCTVTFEPDKLPVFIDWMVKMQAAYEKMLNKKA